MVGCKSSTSSPVCHLFEAHKVGYSTMMHIQTCNVFVVSLTFTPTLQDPRRMAGHHHNLCAWLCKRGLYSLQCMKESYPYVTLFYPYTVTNSARAYADIRWRRCLVIETWGCSMNCFCCTIACESWWFVHWVLRSSGFCHYVLNLASIRCTLSGFYFQLAWSVGFPISGALRVGAKRAQKRANERKNMQTSAILKNGCFESSSL